jgi:hypothetical protein
MCKLKNVDRGGESLLSHRREKKDITRRDPRMYPTGDVRTHEENIHLYGNQHHQTNSKTLFCLQTEIPSKCFFALAALGAVDNIGVRFHSKYEKKKRAGNLYYVART